MTEAVVDLGRPILCFGEILWDALPKGLFPGGAPINVAYHLKQLGLRPVPVTAVGDDFLGRELLRRLKEWGLETDHVSLRKDKPTGVVEVQLGANGIPVYRILEDVAWDWIEYSLGVEELAQGSAALVFGSLAQRSEINRRRLERLIKAASSAMKIFDVNLRPPFDAPALVWQSIPGADLIKLNHEELSKLLGRSFAVGELEAGARILWEKAAQATICVTAAADGAGLLSAGKWHWSRSRPIRVKDTVGAGDAFLAALIHGLLGAGSPEWVLARACRLAELVASEEGATPAYSVSAEGEFVTG